MYRQHTRYRTAVYTPSVSDTVSLDADPRVGLCIHAHRPAPLFALSCWTSKRGRVHVAPSMRLAGIDHRLGESAVRKRTKTTRPSALDAYGWSVDSGKVMVLVTMVEARAAILGRRNDVGGGKAATASARKASGEAARTDGRKGKKRGAPSGGVTVTRRCKGAETSVGGLGGRCKCGKNGEVGGGPRRVAVLVRWSGGGTRFRHRAGSARRLLQLGRLEV